MVNLFIAYLKFLFDKAAARRYNKFCVRSLDKLHTGVPVLIPHDLFRIHEKTKEKKQMPEVLGLNVLEYYNYYIDTENDRLYLDESCRFCLYFQMSYLEKGHTQCCTIYRQSRTPYTWNLSR